MLYLKRLMRQFLGGLLCFISIQAFAVPHAHDTLNHVQIRMAEDTLQKIDGQRVAFYLPYEIRFENVFYVMAGDEKLRQTLGRQSYNALIQMLLDPARLNQSTYEIIEYFQHS